MAEERLEKLMLVEEKKRLIMVVIIFRAHPNHNFHLYRMCICPACLKSVEHPHSQVTHKEECDHLPPWLLVLVGVVGWKPGTEDHKIQSRATGDHRTEITKYKTELLELLTCRKHPG